MQFFQLVEALWVLVPKIAEAPQKRSEPVLDALQTARPNALAKAKETDMTFE